MALVTFLSLVSTGLAATLTEAAFLESSDIRSIALGATGHQQVFPLHHPNAAKEHISHTQKSHTGLNERATGSLDAQLITKKPIGDVRHYQHAMLANGLEVVSVFDNSTKSSAFSVAVTAGMYYDPAEHLGLAHLTEHSLFLGTEKYPDVAGFDQYLAMTGGSSNAYTAEETTVYYGTLDNAGFSEGLDRFADMFRAPLLNASSVYPEVSAVVSEHSKNQENPAWYVEFAMLSTAEETSPIAHFHTGDASTLQNLGAENVTNDIRSYFNKNYCPPRMKLVTFGADSLEDQLKMANRSFGAIPRAGVHGLCEPTEKSFAKPAPFSRETMQKWVLVEGTTSASLWMLFPVDNMAPLTKSHPFNYLQYMLGYGGNGSLSLLLRDHLMLADDVSITSADSSAGTMVWLTAELTRKGVDHPGAVMDVIFTFLEHAKKGATDETINSLAKSAKLMWDWPNPMQADDKVTSGLAEGMTRLAKGDLLSADSLTEEPSKARVVEVLDKLKPSLMNVGLVTPTAGEAWKNDPSATINTLKHYGIKYNVSTMDHWDSTWHDWGKTDDSDDEHMTKAYAALTERLRARGLYSAETPIHMVLPGAIDGIPENMDLAHASAEKAEDAISQLWGAKAQPLTNSDSAELWYRKGWMLKQPWVEVSMNLRTAQKNETPSAQEAVKLQVGMHLLGNELSERLADAGYKGFFFTVSETHDGVYVWLGGFSPNLANLTERLLVEMNKAFDHPSHVHLQRTVGGLKSGYEDYSDEAIKTGFKDLSVLLTPRVHSKKELFEVMQNGDNITWDIAKNAVEDARKGPFYASTLVMGNYNEDDTKNIHDRLLTGLGSTIGVKEEHVRKVTPVVMPKGPLELRKTNPRQGDSNHVTIVTILVGPATVQSRVLMGMVGAMHSQLVFEELRTKDELGYVVSGGVSERSTILEVNCYVQGSKKQPDEVEGLCENVWANIVPNQVSQLDDASFQSHKESFKASLLEGPLSTNQELTHYESSILLGDCLGLRKAMLDFLETVTSKEALLEAWKSAIMPTDGDKVLPRKKVVVKLFSDGMDVPAPMTYEEAEKTYKDAGLHGPTLHRMLQEHNSTQVVVEANSTVRESIVQEGGYFPTDLHCSFDKDAATAAQPNEDAKIDFEVLEKTQEQLPGLKTRRFDAVEISSSGVQPMMRREPEALPHRTESAEEASTSESASPPSMASYRRDRKRFAARRHHVQPQPARPVVLLEGLGGHSARGRGNLPGLSGQKRRKGRASPWAREVLPMIGTESTIPWLSQSRRN